MPAIGAADVERDKLCHRLHQPVAQRRHTDQRRAVKSADDHVPPEHLGPRCDGALPSGASHAVRCHFRGSVVSSPLIYRKTLWPSSETSIPCARRGSFSESRRMVIARSCDIVHLSPSTI